MRTVFFIPPLRQSSGGLENIYAVASCLAKLGRDIALMCPSEAPGLDKARTDGVAILHWGAALRTSDTWCIPEGWPNAMTPGVDAGARVVVYAQNWVYMLGTLPDGVQWRQLPLEYLSVSRPVAWFLRETLNITPAGLLPPKVDDVFFSMGTKPSNRVRVAWMPRKNRALAEQAMLVAEAKLASSSSSPRVEWVCIHKAERHIVADLLSSCHLFLSTGFPEGFGLPPLEAMACGCVPVGCTGFGGWEYMRQAALPGLASRLSPPFELTDDIPGNGFYFADGDSLGTGMALAQAARMAYEQGSQWQNLVKACRRTARRYDAHAQREILERLFS